MTREELLHAIARDCVHFRGDRPCEAHAREGADCRCAAYSPRTSNVLIIQLSSPTAVIQSSALVDRLKGDDPNSCLTYLTSYPELLPASVDVPMRFDGASLLCLQVENFDRVYNLDRDRRACAITNQVAGEVKKGYYLRQGHCMPLDADGHGSYLRAVLPGRWEGEVPCAVRELFQMCGLEYRLELPRLTAGQASPIPVAEEEVVVGLYPQDTEGEVARRGWSEENWVGLAQLLGANGIVPLVLGDARGDAVNQRIAGASGAWYAGPLDWGQIRSAVNACETVVSSSASAVVLAVALGKRGVQVEDRERQDEAREIYRGRAVVVGPKEGEDGELGPERVFEELAKYISRVSEEEMVSPEYDDHRQLANMMRLVSARAEVAQRRVQP